jgi:archaeal flagellar protein FlaI
MVILQISFLHYRDNMSETIDLRNIWSVITGMNGPREKACHIRFRQGQRGTDAVVDCSGCPGGSSMSDAMCRRRVMGALSGKAWVDRLLLQKNIVREYGGDSIKAILSMVSFCDDARLQASTLSAYGCGRCDVKRKEEVFKVLDEAMADPQNAPGMFASLSVGPGRDAPECRSCKERYASFIDDMATIGGRVDTTHISPYVMPRFSTSRIVPEPPASSVFLRSYEVERDEFIPPLHVSIYELPESLERLYFVVPWEYAMEEEDISLLVSARQRLLSQRPDATEFMDPANIRPFFIRSGKESIALSASARGLRLGTARLERLTMALVKYTCGLGILEDVLDDPHIQDTYVNAPVGLNALHVVVDGEECASNIYLSDSDVESMISRLRAISGRPFSEASPVLDMDLGEFHTRVSVIGNPLSRGLAYAFRRHKSTPWTLPQLIHNGMLSPYAAGLLSILADGQSSLLVTGSRGAGKTSLLSALMLEIPQSYRILVIEDTPELPVEDMQRYGWKAQAMGTRASVSGSEAEFQASDVLRAALRLGESALVIGEVRGAEAKSLYEAMRIGASGNSVMGTIHGASCRDVYDRVVHDIGVPAASFRATDAVVVCSTVRSGGGVSRDRRVVQLAEVSKGQWDDGDGAFNDLLTYDMAAGALAATDRIDTGRSEALQAVAKKWGLSIEEACREVEARAAVRKRISDAGASKPHVMEVGAYARCVNVFRVICEKGRIEHGSVDYSEAMASWTAWFDEKFGGNSEL